MMAHKDSAECIEDHKGDCSGEVKYRPSLTGTGTPIPRCEAHWRDRLQREADYKKRFPVRPPADFDPAYAGERWEEDE